MEFFANIRNFLRYVFESTSFSGYIPFFVILTVMALIMRAAHRSPLSTFSVHDMLVSTITSKADVEKMFLVLGSISVTWWFMDMCARHVATWTEAVAYGGLLGLAKVANKALDLKMGTQSSQQPTDGESK